MEIIDTAMLDALSAEAGKNPRLRLNRNFHASLDAPAQRLLNALEPGTRVPAHRHRTTAETYVVLRGRLRITVFDGAGAAKRSVELSPEAGTHGVHIPAGTWHGLEVLESGTVIFEVKDGPYTPFSPEDILNVSGGSPHDAR